MQSVDSDAPWGITSPQLIGTRLVNAGLASAEHVDECLEIQRKRNARGDGPLRLGDILVERGYITRDAIEQLLGDALATPGGRFGETCVRLGLLTPGLLRTALNAQDTFRARGRELLLGQVLTEMRLLTATDVSNVLHEQGLEIAECSRCRLKVNVPDGCSASDLRCARCGRPLLISSEFEEIDLDEPERPAEMIISRSSDRFTAPARQADLEQENIAQTEWMDVDCLDARPSIPDAPGSDADTPAGHHDADTQPLDGVLDLCARVAELTGELEEIRRERDELSATLEQASASLADRTRHLENQLELSRQLIAQLVAEQRRREAL